MSVLLAFAALLAVEGAALFYGQRKLFWVTVRATHSYVLAYILAAPGTVLHESAHYLTALILGVPAGDRVIVRGGGRGRVSFFFPHRGEDGAVTLGSVPLAATDPLRGALISIAPVLLVPPLFAGLTWLLLGTGTLAALWGAFVRVALWKEIVWLYLAFSCGQAAFPSIGDRVGVLGAAALVLLVAVLVVVLLAHGGIGELRTTVRTLALVLAVPSAMAAVSLAAMGTLARGRQPLAKEK